MMSDYIEVVYAPLNSKTIIKQIAFSNNMLLQDAIKISGLLDTHPEIINLDVGIFGKITSPKQKLKPGDRVEIYRQLAINPMEKRRKKTK